VLNLRAVGHRPRAAQRTLVNDKPVNRLPVHNEEDVTRLHSCRAGFLPQRDCFAIHIAQHERIASLTESLLCDPSLPRQHSLLRFGGASLLDREKLN
jgi:hypothetical protein